MPTLAIHDSIRHKVLTNTMETLFCIFIKQLVCNKKLT